MNCPYCHHEIEEEKPVINKVFSITVKDKPQKIRDVQKIGGNVKSNHYLQVVPVYVVEDSQS